MIDKIDAWQVFWAILIMLGSYISIMITLFRNEQKEIKKDVALCVTIVACKDFRADCEKTCAKSRVDRDKFIERLYQEAEGCCDDLRRDLSKTSHSHAAAGTAGEVVPK